MPIENRDDTPILGVIGVDRFLRDYWQKKPLLVRQAIPGFRALVSKKSLLELAGREDVQSRLITSFGGLWSMRHGPFERLPKQDHDWTMLVQSVNLYKPLVDRLMRRFAFVPYSRLDDIMISLAADGGGVGPHFDSYDVFLLQAQGRRRWRVSSQKDLSVHADLPLKILQNFTPEEEWVLEPGDMLYLPPQYAHDGQAIGSCMTYSVGFRAPTYTELAREFLFSLAERIELPGRVTDTGRKRTDSPARLDSRLLRSAADRLAHLRGTSRDVTDFIGRFMTEPKPHIFFRRTRMSAARFVERTQSHGVRLDLKTQMLYRKKNVYINGESLTVTSGQAHWLAQLANARYATAPTCSALVADAALGTLLHNWFSAGWLRIGGDDE